MKMENTRKNPRIQMSGIVEAKKADVLNLARLGGTLF